MCLEERSLRPLVAGSLNGNVSYLTSLADNGPLDLLVLESIDETLTDLLGRKSREAVYDYLERNCLLGRIEVPRRLDEFFRLMDDTFGKGSKTIAKVIARKLYAKLGWEFVEIPSYELEDYIELLKTRIEKEIRNHVNSH